MFVRQNDRWGKRGKQGYTRRRRRHDEKWEWKNEIKRFADWRKGRRSDWSKWDQGRRKNKCMRCDGGMDHSVITDPRFHYFQFLSSPRVFVTSTSSFSCSYRILLVIISCIFLSSVLWPPKTRGDDVWIKWKAPVIFMMLMPVIVSGISFWDYSSSPV